MIRKGRKKILKGENHPSAKLTKEDIDEIRKSHIKRGRTGTSNSMELSIKYGVTRAHINRIASGKKWRVC
jgi:hypothetical protein